MKPILIWLFTCSLGTLGAQDLIILRSEGEIPARILSITQSHVRYLESQGDDKPRKLSKNEIELIVYADGMKQYFTVQPYEADTVKFASNDAEARQLYEQGVKDARQYYNRNGPMWGTFGATAFYPFFGIFTGVATGAVIVAVPPKLKPEYLPNPQLCQQSPEYAEGYRRMAQKRKLGKAAKGFALGMGVQTFYLLLLFALF